MENVVLVQAVDLQPQMGEGPFIVLHQIHAVLRQRVAEQNLFRHRIVAHGAVTHDQRGVYRHIQKPVAGHRQTSPGCEGEYTALLHEIPNKIQIGLGDMAAVVGHGLVKIGDQDQIGKLAHGAASFACFPYSIKFYL